ncbi:hypothetical protein ACU60T_25240 [Klebsiella aerogenes]
MFSCSIFPHKPQSPVVVRYNLIDEEKAALQPIRSLTLGWISFVEELELEAARLTCEAGTSAYLISDFEQDRFIHARTTVYA